MVGSVGEDKTKDNTQERTVERADVAKRRWTLKESQAPVVSITLDSLPLIFHMRTKNPPSGPLRIEDKY